MSHLHYRAELKEGVSLATWPLQEVDHQKTTCTFKGLHSPCLTDYTLRCYIKAKIVTNTLDHLSSVSTARDELCQECFTSVRKKSEFLKKKTVFPMKYLLKN